MKLKCTHCGKQFEHHRDKKTCSAECFSAVQRNPNAWSQEEIDRLYYFAARGHRAEAVRRYQMFVRTKPHLPKRSNYAVGKKLLRLLTQDGSKTTDNVDNFSLKQISEALGLSYSYFYKLSKQYDLPKNTRFKTRHTVSVYVLRKWLAANPKAAVNADYLGLMFLVDDQEIAEHILQLVSDLKRQRNIERKRPKQDLNLRPTA